MSHHAPYTNFFGIQIITANSAYPQCKCMTCEKGYIPIIFVPQVSIGVQNVLGVTLPVPKTIFPHLVEFSWLKGLKNGVPMM